jgi:hypothetical protein
MHRQRIGNSGGDDDVGVYRNRFDGGGLAPLRMPAGYSALDAEVASFDPAEPRIAPSKWRRGYASLVTMKPMRALFGVSCASAHRKRGAEQ